MGGGAGFRGAGDGDRDGFVAGRVFGAAGWAGGEGAVFFAAVWDWGGRAAGGGGGDWEGVGGRRGPQYRIPQPRISVRPWSTGSRDGLVLAIRGKPGGGGSGAPLGIPQILGRVGLEVEGELAGGVGADDRFEELHVEGVVLHHFEFRHGGDFEGEEEGPLGFLIGIAAGADAEDFGDLEEEAARGAHHAFQGLGIDLWLEFVEGDVGDHLRSSN